MSADFVLEYLKKQGIAITRETYVYLSTLGDQDGSSGVLDGELEAELPEELQHPDFKGEEEDDVRR